MNFVQKHIVTSFIEFCASEKGCPGVQFVVAVLRTDCVRELTPRELRKECQSMLLEELKKKLQMGIEDQLQDRKGDRELMFDHIHHWPEIRAPDYPQFELSEGLESAQRLLSSGEVNDVVTSVHKKHQELWLNLEGLREVSDRLDHACKEHPCSLLSPTGGEHSSWEEFSLERELKTQLLCPLVSGPSFQKREDLSPGEKLILQGMHEVQENVHEMQENMIANFAQVREDLRHLKSSFKELHLHMSKVNSSVDRIIRYKILEEKHRCPRRPYFSPHVRFSKKVKAKVLSSHAVRLHLMCEARNFVQDQPGLELLLKKDGEFAKWMRRLSIISLNMIWMLLKIGVQVTAGVGSLIPHVSNLSTGLSVAISVATVNVLLEQLKLEVEKNISLVNNHRSCEEAWCGLRDYLAPYLIPEKCAELFRLHLVRYKNIYDPYAWLCEPCMLSARRNFLLE